MNDETRQWLSDVAQPDYRERVKAILKAKRISQAEFARMCGCSASNVYAWLSQYSWQRFPKYMWAVARRLGVHYERA